MHESEEERTAAEVQFREIRRIRAQSAQNFFALVADSPFARCAALAKAWVEIGAVISITKYSTVIRTVYGCRCHAERAFLLSTEPAWPNKRLSARASLRKREWECRGNERCAQQ
jgi:hypothetical protein